MIRKLSSIFLFFLTVAALGGIYVLSEKARADALAAPQPQTADTKVVANYFHSTVRCITCRKIEGYSREVVEQKFGADIANGRLQFKLVNGKRQSIPSIHLPDLVMNWEDERRGSGCSAAAAKPCGGCGVGSRV